MKIIAARRICQVFFFLLFVWFCVVTTLGEDWWQLRGWPVNWIIQLDPLVGLATLLTTKTVYAGLLWGLGTMVVTILLGRFFCGWACPFGAIHQFVGFLAHRKRSTRERIERHQYHRLQSIKYWILIFLLTVSALELAQDFLVLPGSRPALFGAAVMALMICMIVAVRRKGLKPLSAGLLFILAVLLWLLLYALFYGHEGGMASLQIGLLDPISLSTRSFNLVILPFFNNTSISSSITPRFYEGAGLIGTIFLTAVLLNLAIPRFYCRFVCPAGALFGILSRFAIWRIGKTRHACTDCRLCERDCEGACEPASRIRVSECVLCMNCLDRCQHQLMTYQMAPSATGEVLSPDFTRRQFLVSAVTGAAVIPALRLGGYVDGNWNPLLVRPPGALPEKAFLSRCIKCGQCMRICPTNVIHPAGFQAGLEGLWTPVLNFRVGASGCQFNCIACGNICPTAAIRPITLDERLGKNAYAPKGPVKIGTAFIDRGRCLPWAMNTPCIVCQENCPVSPKAIYTQEIYRPVYTRERPVSANSDSLYMEFSSAIPGLTGMDTGDYFVVLVPPMDDRPRRIVQVWERGLRVAGDQPFEPTPPPGTPVEIRIRLQQPFVDPKQCIGCGVCEHECPVPGRRAVSVTADNESRDPDHTLLLKRA